MQITTCKKPTKSLSLSRDIDDLLYQRTLDMHDHTQIKWHDNTEASIDKYLDATNKQHNSALHKDMDILLFWRRFEITKYV